MERDKKIMKKWIFGIGVYTVLIENFFTGHIWVSLGSKID